MKRISVLACGVMCCIAMLANVAFAGGGFLPPTCYNGFNPLSPTYSCPSPYVSMQPDGGSTIFDLSWHCLETEMSLATTFEASLSGECVGQRGMIDGWTTFPDGLTLTHRAEIVEHVISPCFFGIVRDNALDAWHELDDILTLLKIWHVEEVNALIAETQHRVIGQEFSDRLPVYAEARARCRERIRQIPK